MDGYFDDLAWGDVFHFMYFVTSLHNEFWFVAGDHLHREKWMVLKNMYHPGHMLDALDYGGGLPLDLYDCPSDYYSNRSVHFTMSGDERRLYGVPDRRWNWPRISLLPCTGGRRCESSAVYRWRNRSDAFTKTYDRRMKRVEADMKVILWKSLRHLRVRGHCFPWDCCELIVSFLAVTPITGGYTLCVLK